MSRKREFHPKLSTLDIAKFQLMEQGFVGISNGVTLIPAKDAHIIQVNILKGMIAEVLNKKSAPNPSEMLDLLSACRTFLGQYPEDPSCSAIVVFKPSVEDGVDNVQPVGRIIDPWEVVEPEFAHTDGAGNVREDERAGDNPTNHSGSKGNGRDSG